ncbi:DUF4920 domain-containing protein [Pontibacter litorisediminis]|uniref:DUF4920 domain-containing protein n=1 Tax=Pontibacter litorisediminis TaxID=1846260 RepID=UPI0023ED01CE|nr:DUF4920 domain-containing protein [Pontibacter litorisediminis]
MKNASILLLLAVAAFGCDQTKSSATNGTGTETTAPGAGSAYGAAFTEEHVIPASELTTAIAGKDSLQATVAAEIKESCQKKGCWMDVKLDDDTHMKVTFRDYGFFVPTENLEGRQVVFTGTAKREVVSVEDLRHFAEDAGKSAEEVAAITTPREELRFVADGVLLK